MSTSRRNGYHSSKKKNYFTPNQKRKNYLQPGNKGFLATCNFHENDCIRESYNILNHYSDILYGSHATKNASDTTDSIAESKHIEELDIASQLKEEVSALNAKGRNADYRFHAVDTGVQNMLFIKSALPDNIELGLHIMRDISETKEHKARFLLRLVPIEAVCKANIKDIIDAAGILFDKHFLREPKSFSIVYNRRYNNSLNRDEIIKELATLVTSKNSENKANLKNPQLAVIVEIIKGLCLLSVVPDYVLLKKYNLHELCGEDKPPVIKNSDESQDTLVVSTANDKDEVKE